MTILQIEPEERGATRLGYLILVKHAMPIIDPTLPASNWQLSPSGVEKSQLLANKLLRYRPGAILSSKELKAKATAEIIGRTTGLAVDLIPGLHEHDRTGVPLLEASKFHASMRRFFSNPSKAIFGRESADEAYHRFDMALSEWLTSSDHRNPAIVVTHGTVMSLYLSNKFETDPYALWARLGLPSYVVVSWPQFSLLEIVDQVE